MFLLYLLARLLGERKTVALQISARRYVLFTEQGANIYKGDSPSGIPPGAWVLSDSLGKDEIQPCSAFLFSDAYLVHTSSPAAHIWKDWTKQVDAMMHVMDLWSEEFKHLLYVRVVYSVLCWHFGLALFLDPIFTVGWNSLGSMDQTSGPSPPFFLRLRTRNDTFVISMRVLQNSHIHPQQSC